MRPGRRFGYGSALAWLALCPVACADEPQAAPVRRPALEAQALVQGLGDQACRSDQDCAEGPSLGGCLLGTCFGILTTDSRPVRRVLVERLRAADAAVREKAAPLLLEALQRDAGLGLRVAAIEGLGALAAASGAQACGEVCAALTAQAAAPEERVAVAARLALGAAGVADVRPALIEDLIAGTELLRVEAARALAAHTAAPEARTALLHALEDPSSTVRQEALQALAAVVHLPEVRARVQARRAAETALPAYAYDRLLTPAPTTP